MERINESINEYACCRYCEKGIYMPVTGKTMCKLKGVVSGNSVCGKFVFDPFRMKVNRVYNFDFSKYESEDYSIE